MNSDEISSADTSDWIAVLPLGAHEQHGPHLPFETDTIIAQGIADHLSERLPDAFPVTFLPTERVGYSIEHLDFEGSQTLSYDEAVNRWVTIGTNLAQLGVRKLLLLNAHGGNSPLTTIVATELRIRCDMLCVATSWLRHVVAGDIISHEEKAYGIHGGDIETSVMLALAPDLVDMNSARDFSNLQSKLSQRFKHLKAYGPNAFGWKAQDLNPEGVTGNAAEASAAKGQALIAQSVNGLAELVQEMRQFSLDEIS